MYIGHAPFGYKKSTTEKNRLIVNEDTAETVRLIFMLYRKGYGYESIAGMLNEKHLDAPKGPNWNAVTVGRIIRNRAYVGDTVQGISERISFKSKKIKLQPKTNWVITEKTHEAIISDALFDEVQQIRMDKKQWHLPHKDKLYALRGLIYCGDCGSIMYARLRKKGRVAYVCGNYFRNGAEACSSHLIYEYEILEHINEELCKAFNEADCINALKSHLEEAGLTSAGANLQLKRLRHQLELKLRHQQMVYGDRLEGRISTEFFDSTNRLMEKRINELKQEIHKLSCLAPGQSTEGREAKCIGAGGEEKLITTALEWLKDGTASNEAIRTCISRVTVYDQSVVVDFKMKKD